MKGDESNISPLVPRSASVLMALLGLGCFFFFVFRLWPYTMDDAFITFRYAKHLAEGHGLVFNPGDFPRTEGVTSPFYAAMLALPVLLGLDILTSAKVLGVVVSLVSGFVLAALIARLAEATACVTSSRARLFGALGALAFWANPHVAVHTVRHGNVAWNANAACVRSVFLESACA